MELESDDENEEEDENGDDQEMLIVGLDDELENEEDVQVEEEGPAYGEIDSSLHEFDGKPEYLRKVPERFA